MRQSDLRISEGYPVIFTNGAFIEPVKLKINGRTVWKWVVVSFEDDSFYDGEICDPKEFATDKRRLLSFHYKPYRTAIDKNTVTISLREQLRI